MLMTEEHHPSAISCLAIQIPKPTATQTSSFRHTTSIPAAPVCTPVFEADVLATVPVRISVLFVGKAVRTVPTPNPPTDPPAVAVAVLVVLDFDTLGLLKADQIKAPMPALGRATSEAKMAVKV